MKPRAHAGTCTNYRRLLRGRSPPPPVHTTTARTMLKSGSWADSARPVERARSGGG